MSLRLWELRQLRQQLEDICHPLPWPRWIRRLRSFDVAGVPRSVYISERTEVITGMIFDTELPAKARLAAYLARAKNMATPAYRERVMLDQNELQRYLKKIRENGYRMPTYHPAQSNDLSKTQDLCWSWVEDPSKRDQELVLTPAELELEKQIAREARKIITLLKMNDSEKKESAAADHESDN